jgi:serine/threonine protein kinase
MGPYRVIRPLGSGGMGEVFLAVDDRDGVEVAVKVLRPELCADPDFRQRFGREVEAARRVHGRSIARVLGADLEAAQPWIATEYVPGPTLREAHEGLELRALAAGLARALADIHAAGVVHRDLTPSNVILGPNGPRVVDFGIAWFGDATTLTRTGTVLGTPAWMAPEQLGDDRTTSASDVWAWGAVVAFAATGRPPVTGSRPEVIQVRAARGELDLEGVPDWLLPLVRRAMDPDPIRRPTADQLATELGVPSDNELTQVLERTWVQAPPAVVGPTVVEPPVRREQAAAPEPSRPDRRRSGRLAALAPRWSLGLALAVVGGAFAAVAGYFAIILVVVTIVVVAACIRIWEIERLPRPHLRWSPSPSSLVVAALVTTGVGLTQAVGVVFGLLALVAIVIFLIAIGAHGG